MVNIGEEAEKMGKRRKKLSVWEHYLAMEIAIEFKACLYFFAILFFYCMYRLLIGSAQASILHMAEMIFLTYAMGYMQVYLLSGFDEGERLGVKESLYLALCSLIYAGSSFFGGWFGRVIWISILFFLYVAFLYVCVFFVYKSKRKLDDKIMNENLKLFQARGADYAESD